MATFKTGQPVRVEKKGTMHEGIVIGSSNGQVIVDIGSDLIACHECELELIEGEPLVLKDVKALNFDEIVALLVRVEKAKDELSRCIQDVNHILYYLKNIRNERE